LKPKSESTRTRWTGRSIKNKKPRDFAVLSDEQRDVLVAEALAKDPSTSPLGAELGRPLQLGPDDSTLSI
jgi:hypothetical protein